ncbi:MAG: hypothetical protein QXI22_09225 [Sulfolobales archaeon]
MISIGKIYKGLVDRAFGDRLIFILTLDGDGSIAPNRPGNDLIVYGGLDAVGLGSGL